MSRFFTLKVRGIQNVYGIQRLIPQAVRRYRLYSFLRTFSTAVLALGFEWYTFSISYRAARSTPPAVSEIFDANKAPTQLVIIMTVNANGSYPASVCAQCPQASTAVWHCPTASHSCPFSNCVWPESLTVLRLRVDLVVRPSSTLGHDWVASRWGQGARGQLAGQLNGWPAS